MTDDARAANARHLAGFRVTGVRFVRVYNGVDFDQECRSANGSIWTIDYAESHLLEHPDCGRSFAAVSDEEAAQTP